MRDGSGRPTQGKALLIIPYFGAFGPWFPLYLYSLGRQRTLDLLLLTDREPGPLPANVRCVPITFDGLRSLATNKLGTTVRLERTRNICDLRPAFGLVFADFVRGYEYWAFGDEDVLYGDLDQLLGSALDGVSDVVVPATNGKSGHLTLLKNAPRTNELAMKDPAYKDVLTSYEHWAYDETSWRWGTHISSFHTIVTDAAARGELSIHAGIPRVTGVPQHGRWFAYRDGRLHEGARREILYYHWGRMRHLKVRWPSAADAERGFAFDRYGFYDADLGDVRLRSRRVVGRLREGAASGRQALSQWRGEARLALRLE